MSEMLVKSPRVTQGPEFIDPEFRNNRRTEMREVDRLAHALALETSICAVHCASERVTREAGEADIEWLELDAEQRESVKGELRYLELRGALEWHPSLRDWLRIVSAGVIE